ncbi:hypothetical protein AB9F35_35105, partial [Rhizobium leguminosarum]
EAQHDLTMKMLGADSNTGAVYEPTMAHLSEKRGDTVHIDFIDRDGNMVSVTPSGGWLQSSTTVWTKSAPAGFIAARSKPLRID